MVDNALATATQDQCVARLDRRQEQRTIGGGLTQAFVFENRFVFFRRSVIEGKRVRRVAAVPIGNMLALRSGNPA
jgi:hypothetical protein